jgi:hypothetical protein
MMSSRRTGMVLASISALAMLGEVTAASAQPYDQAPPPPGYDQGQGNDQGPPPGNDQAPPDQNANQAPPPQGYDQGPPPGYNQAPPPGYNQAPSQGQYAPPPPGGAYNGQAQQYDQDYAARYSAWAAQYCVDRRNNNTAAGAIIGGVLGAVIGSSVAGRHDRGGGAIVGGVLGAGAGAAVGSSSTDTRGCPPGYVIRAGAPVFYYGGGPAYGPAYWGPSWYNPWVWSGGRYVYTPYRRWYYGHPGYWRGGRRHYH